MRKEIEVGGMAPDFVLTDTGGEQIRLSDYRSRQIVVLVLTRGFV